MPNQEYKCEQCGARFYEALSLAEHRQLHGEFQVFFAFFMKIQNLCLHHGGMPQVRQEVLNIRKRILKED